MDIRKFIVEVREMRKAQREYFRYRAQGWLIRAKEHESVVDGMLKEYFDERAIQRGFDF